MSCFEDFQVLSVLGSCSYKVKNKKTSEVFVWKTLNTTVNLSNLLNERREQNRLLSLLHIYENIYHESTNTTYLVTEYCKYGSLKNVIGRCVKRNEHLDEDFLWGIVYKLAYICKTTKIINFSIKNVFLDAELNIKLQNFNPSDEICDNIKDLGRILNAIIYFDEDLNKKLEFPEYYSGDLKNLLNFLINHENDVQPTIEAVLSHPTVLFKQSLCKNKEIFLKHNDLVDKKCNNEEELVELTYQTRLECLRKREAAIKLLDQKLQLQMHNLDKREKKVALMERIVKEKTTRADLYLKRAREVKVTSKGNSIPRKELENKFDTSYSADCGESVILATSRKLNVADIVKPSKFTRSMSERRVRFKSHSPLKEIHNIRRDVGNKERTLFLIPENETKTCEIQSDSDKTSETNSEKQRTTPGKKKKKKFNFSSIILKKPKKPPSSITSSSDSVSAHTYEDLDKGWDDLKQDCKPINWTEESKRQAFDLLRIMNEEHDINEIQHTFL